MIESYVCRRHLAVALLFSILPQNHHCNTIKGLITHSLTDKASSTPLGALNAVMEVRRRKQSSGVLMNLLFAADHLICCVLRTLVYGALLHSGNERWESLCGADTSTRGRWRVRTDDCVRDVHDEWRSHLLAARRCTASQLSAIQKHARCVLLGKFASKVLKVADTKSCHVAFKLIEVGPSDACDDLCFYFEV